MRLSAGRAIEAAAIVALGLGAGLSPLLLGYYASTTSSTIGAVLAVAATAAICLARPRLSVAAMLSLGALLLIGVFALLSATWSPSPDGAIVDANRFFAYAALLTLAVALARDERRRQALLAAAAVGLFLTAAVVVVRMLGSAPQNIFLDARLAKPIGYPPALGCTFVLGAWLAMAVALGRHPAFAGAGAFGATLMVCLALLTETRGVLVSLVLSAVIVVAAFPGRRLAWALVVVIAATVAALPALLHLYDVGGRGVPVDAAHSAAGAVIAASLGAALVWGIATALAQRFTAQGKAPDVRRVSTAGLILIAVLALGVVVARASPIEREVRRQWHQFVHTGPETGPKNTPAGEVPRILIGGGPFHEYWHVTLKTLGAHPFGGSGGGSWENVWFKKRRINEAIAQPNSLVFSTLLELGGLGGALLLVFAIGVGLAARRVTKARAGETTRALGICGLAMSVVWIASATTDWLFVGAPGVIAVGLLGTAVLLAPRIREQRAGHLYALAAVLVLAVGGATLTRQAVADHLRSHAASQLVSNPKSALSSANSSLSVNGNAVTSYYVRAAALARLQQPRAAHAALVDALAKEPDNFIAWILLGDLDIRTKQLVGARRAYSRALALDPLEGQLVQVIKNPASGLAALSERPSFVETQWHGFQLIKNTPPIQEARAIGTAIPAGGGTVSGLFGWGLSPKAVATQQPPVPKATPNSDSLLVLLAGAAAVLIVAAAAALTSALGGRRRARAIAP